MDTEQLNELAENYSEAELYQLDQFACQYAFGMPIPNALIAAGYGTRSLARGFELLRIPYVQARIDENRAWVKDKLVDNINTLLQQLDADRSFAYAQMNPSAAVAATNAKAKLLGLLDPDKSKQLPAKITIEWGTQESTPQDDVQGGAV